MSYAPSITDALGTLDNHLAAARPAKPAADALDRIHAARHLSGPRGEAAKVEASLARA